MNKKLPQATTTQRRSLRQVSAHIPSIPRASTDKPSAQRRQFQKPKTWLLFAMLIFQMIFIFVMSSFGPDSSNAQSGSIVQVISHFLPKSNAYDLVFLVRKTAHFIEYAILGLLFYLNIKNFTSISIRIDRPQQTSIFIPILAVLASALYACTDEFHQLFVPGRSGQLFDVFVDTLGALTGILLVILILKIKSKIHSRSST